ncbi:MAG TPA: hypothetical protein VIV60_01765, partial [Polyangiaceae bacterium]
APAPLQPAPVQPAPVQPAPVQPIPVQPAPTPAAQQQASLPATTPSSLESTSPMVAPLGSNAALEKGPVAKTAAWPPAVLPYQEGMPIPSGYHLDSHINSGLMWSGLAIWAVPYAAGLIAAAASGFPKQSGWLALPVAGPFVAMGGRTIDCDILGYDANSAGYDLQAKQAECKKQIIKEARVLGLLTVDGLLQTTGAIMAIAGMASSSESLLRNDVFPPDSHVSFDAGYVNGQFRLHARMLF